MSRHREAYTISYHGTLCHDMSYVTTIAASLLLSINYLNTDHDTEVNIAQILYKYNNIIHKLCLLTAVAIIFNKTHAFLKSVTLS